MISATLLNTDNLITCNQWFIILFNQTVTGNIMATESRITVLYHIIHVQKNKY